MYALGMVERFSPSAVLRELRAGPGSSEPPSAHKVYVSSQKYPDRYKRVLIPLHYRMLETQFKSQGRDTIRKHANFINAWRGQLDDDASQFLFGSLDAYTQGNKAKLFELNWEKPSNAPAIAKSIRTALPAVGTIAGLSSRVLLGQIQSTFSREDAAQTFRHVRNHSKSTLVADFFWDTGALTYYSEAEVAAKKRQLPSLIEMTSWSTSEGAGAAHAIVISMDPKFFRMYAPMVLFNAQQLPDLDFIIVLCAPQEEAESLHREAQSYMHALSNLNAQRSPQNIRFYAVDTPVWVGNEQTFYACARFLVLPDLLKSYSSVYAIDADLFLVRDPTTFIAANAAETASFPKTSGLLGVPPWRRFMAGNFVANRNLPQSTFFQRMMDYLSVGLAEPKSWMLDQNAITFGVEGATPGEWTALSAARPTLVGPFMAKWERNFSIANPSRQSQ